MRFEQALAIVNNHGLEMLDAPNSGLLAVAVGAKGGGSVYEAKEFSITGYVIEKLSGRELAHAGTVAFHDVYAETTGGSVGASADLEIVACGSAFEPFPGLSVPAAQRGLYGGSPPTVDVQKRFGSLCIGIGIDSPTGSYPKLLSAGTAGFYLRDDKKNLYVVSNNHVIGRSNAGLPREPVVQPGTLDLTAVELAAAPTLHTLVPLYQVAELTAFVHLQFRTPHNIPVNTVDAALARLTGARTTSEIDRLAFGGVLRAAATTDKVAAPYATDANGALQGSMRVHKLGRTTGYTEGIVTGLGGVATIPYGAQTAHFANQIVVSPTTDNGGPFSKRGDSGSGVLNDRHELVGLLFAGAALQTLVNPIADVFLQLRAAAAAVGVRGLELVCV